MTRLLFRGSRSLPLFLLLLQPACALQHSQAAKEFEVTSLPGLNHTELAQFSQWAGLLHLTAPDDPEPRRLFFWLIESENDPTNDPLVLWTNGGPGCSSLLGLLSENGPFRPTQDGASLDVDPFSWTKRASVVFVEQPVLVGFSDSQVLGDEVSDDLTNAVDLAHFVEQFLDVFTGLANHSFYLSGESFAGHYLPSTAEELLRVNTRRRAVGRMPINFRGFLVGNPYTNPSESNKGVMGALYGHSMLPKTAYDDWRRRCDWGDSTEDECYWWPWWLFDHFVRDDVNPYALTYPLCHSGASAAHKQRFRLLDMLLQTNGLAVATGDDTSTTAAPLSSGRLQLLYEPCREEYLTAWLNRADVRRALHVDHNRSWEVCSDPVWYNYSAADFDRDMVPVYKRLLWRTDSPLAPGEEPLKILVFSGDDDSVCGTHGTQAWVFRLAVNVTAMWQPWYYSDPVYGEQIAGYRTELAGLHFATVHGAGHEVPAYKPAAALQLFHDFLALNSTGGPAVAGPVLLTSDTDACNGSEVRLDDDRSQHGKRHQHEQTEPVSEANEVAYVVGGTMLVLGLILGGLGVYLHMTWHQQALRRDFSKLELTEMDRQEDADEAGVALGAPPGNDRPGGDDSGGIAVLSALHGGMSSMAVGRSDDRRRRQQSARASISTEMV